MSHLYSYRCPSGHNFDEMTLVDERNDPHKCPECDAWGQRVLSPSRFTIFHFPYYSDSLGKVINSPADLSGNFDKIRRSNAESNESQGDSQ